MPVEQPVLDGDGGVGVGVGGRGLGLGWDEAISHATVTLLE